MITVTKHTPGPWVIDGLFDADTGVDILAVEDPAKREDGVRICEVLPFEEDWTELEIANVKLIAAAPQLLEALAHIRMMGYNSKAARATDTVLACIRIAEEAIRIAGAY